MSKLLGLAGIVGGFLLILAIKVAFGAAAAGGVGYAKREYALSNIERDLSALPGEGPMYAALQRLFPNEYANLTQEIRKVARSGDSAGDMKSHMQSYNSTMMKPILDSATKASDRRIGEYFKASLDVLKVLQTSDPQKCARYVGQGSDESMEDVPNYLAAAGKMGVALIEAAAEGRDTPAERSKPSDEQNDRLIDQIKARGITDDDLKNVGTNTGLIGAGEKKCATAVALYDSVYAMPMNDQPVMMAMILTK